MVKKCSVPGCKSNYRTTWKKTRRYISIFSFPKNEKLKRCWLESICRKDFTPSLHSGVCEFHFDENDILKYDKFLQSDGIVQSVLLKRPKLKENAVPKLLPSNSKRKMVFNDRYKSAKEDVNTLSDNAVSQEDGAGDEFKEIDLHYADIDENFIKQEVIDDNEEIIIQIGTDDLNCLSEQVSDDFYYADINEHFIKEEMIDESEDCEEIIIQFETDELDFLPEQINEGHLCSICGETFTEDLDLQAHLEVHVIRIDTQCMICGEEFIDEQACAEHVEKQHPNEKSLPSSETCNICGESFSDAIDLRAHIEVHVRGFDFRCMICGEDFIDEQACAVHVEEQHSNEKSSSGSEALKTCNICGESFSNAIDLRVHIEVHVRGFDFRCMICGEDFIDEQACETHVDDQHSEPHQTSSEKSKFGDDVSTHHNNNFSDDVMDKKQFFRKKRKTYRRRLPQQYPCRICGKTFGSKNSQDIHIRKHTGERPYSCSFCQKSFSDTGSLRKHKRIHTGEKPYACVVCLKAFNQRVVLRNHIKSCHSLPDLRNQYAETPYPCSVCAEVFTTPQKIIDHLINHCDMNTVMKMSSEMSQRIYKTRTGLKYPATEGMD